MITPKDILDNPDDYLRIGPIMYEIRGLWIEHPEWTFGKLIRRIIEKEYHKEYFFTMTDDEFLAAIQNYGDKQ